MTRQGSKKKVYSQALNATEESKIAIIGAGPAGILASLWLTKNNTPHLLIDAATFPREKACGDVLPAAAIRCLNEIDEAIIPDMLGKGLIAPIGRTEIVTPRYRSLKVGFRNLDDQENVPSCYSVKRAAFDAYLLDRAGQSPYAGILLDTFIKDIRRTNDQLHLDTKDGRAITCSLLILASGSNSPLREKLAVARRKDDDFAIGIRAYFKGVGIQPQVAQLYLDKAVFPGGLYITPLSDSTCNVNLVIKKDIALKRKTDLKKQFSYLLDNNELLKHRFQNAEQLGEFKGSSLFLGTKRRRISGEGFMLAGDAAGLIDLLSANGIPQAMISGKFAAQKAVECLEANNFSASFMAGYDKKLNARIKSYLSLTRLANPFISYTWFRRLSFFLIHTLAGRHSGNSPVADLLYAKKPLYSLLNPVFYSRLVTNRLRNGKS